MTEIFAEEDVPNEWASYTKKNYVYFEGAKKGKWCAGVEGKS